MALGPLSTAESRQLVESELQRATGRRGADHAHPRPRRRQSVLPRRAGPRRPRAARGALASAVPATVHDVLTARIDGAHRYRPQVLHVAAVHGPRRNVAPCCRKSAGAAPTSACAPAWDGCRPPTSWRASPSAWPARVQLQARPHPGRRVQERARADRPDGPSRPGRPRHPEAGGRAPGERRPEITGPSLLGGRAPAEAVRLLDSRGPARHPALGPRRCARALSPMRLDLLGDAAGRPGAGHQEVMVPSSASAPHSPPTRGYGAPEAGAAPSSGIGTLADQLADASQEFPVRWTAMAIPLLAGRLPAGGAAGQATPGAGAERQDDPMAPRRRPRRHRHRQVLHGRDSALRASISSAGPGRPLGRGLSARSGCAYGQDLGVGAPRASSAGPRP